MSATYLALLAGALAVYYAVPGKLQWTVLLAASGVFFVTSCGWAMLPYLAAGVAVSCGGTRLLARASGKRRKLILAATLTLLLGELFILKYLNFIPSSVNVLARLFSFEWQMRTVSLAAPIGISYYTLSLTGYVLDVYWESYPPVEGRFGLARLALFACYFPQMTSGPVTRYQQMQRELFAVHRPSYRTLSFGAQRILWGFFKKLLVAEWLIRFIRSVHAQIASLPGIVLLLAAVLYVFYLYADFSGCMDIILGSSEMFGVGLPENFRQPFYSPTVAEFWRRWHITLGQWFRDYLMYPLLRSAPFQRLKRRCRSRWGKAASKAIPTYCGVAVLWLFIGFWHQGTWKYIFCSGLLPGTYLIVGDILQPACRRLRDRLHIRAEALPYQVFCWARTFVLLLPIFLFVGVSSLSGGAQMIVRIFTAFAPQKLTGALLYSLSLNRMKTVAYGLGCMMLIDLLALKHGDVRALIARQKLPVRWAVYLGLLFSVLLLSPNLTAGVGDFMYAQF